MTMKYKVVGGVPGTSEVWAVAVEGEIVASLHGPMSALVALAACEKLNSDFQMDGWVHRLGNEIDRGVFQSKTDNDIVEKR
jgi:hypothetical protein